MTIDLNKKPMGSIRNTPKAKNTKYMDKGDLIGTPSRTVSVPSNVTPPNTRRIADSPVFGNVAPAVTRPKMTLNRNSTKRRVPGDNLNTNTSKPNVSSQKRSKKDIAIADVDYIPTYKTLSDTLAQEENKTDEADILMKEFDIDEMQQKTDNLKAELDKYRKEALEKAKKRKREVQPVTAKYISENLAADTLLDVKELSREMAAKKKAAEKEGPIKERDLSLNSLINNKDKAEQIEVKYAKDKKRRYVRKDLIRSIDDIRKLVAKYRHVIVDILNGKIGSFFYNQAKIIQQSSQLLTIKGDQLFNLPKHTYYGYIGASRGFHIGKAIQDDFELKDLLRIKMAYSDVINFWGINNFSQYVLTPELIAHLIKDEGKLEDMDYAYDEMEDTNEYGMYVTNMLELEGKDGMAGDQVEIASDLEDSDEEVVPVKSKQGKIPSTKTSSTAATASATTVDIPSDSSDSDDDADEDDDNLIGDIFG